MCPLVICLVELGGLEPPAPCLQNRPKLSMRSLNWDFGYEGVRWNRVL